MSFYLAYSQDGPEPPGVSTCESLWGGVAEQPNHGPPFLGPLGQGNADTQQAVTIKVTEAYCSAE